MDTLKTPQFPPLWQSLLSRIEDLAGPEAAEKIAREFGGCRVYLPRVSVALEFLLHGDQADVKASDQVIEHGHGSRVITGIAAQANVAVGYESSGQLHGPV